MNRPQVFRQTNVTSGMLEVLTTSSATEGEVALLDMSKVNLVFYGSPHLLADRFSGTNALTGETTLYDKKLSVLDYEQRFYSPEII